MGPAPSPELVCSSCMVFKAALEAGWAGDLSIDSAWACGPPSWPQLGRAPSQRSPKEAEPHLAMPWAGRWGAGDRSWWPWMLGCGKMPCLCSPGFLWELPGNVTTCSPVWARAWLGPAPPAAAAID